MTIHNLDEAQFPVRQRRPRPPQDPEALFGLLPKTPTRAPVLWAHQADQLRTYHADHRNTPDVALELPTGSGKTLMGLLISEWRRRALAHRAVIACPTQQLAEQVHASGQAQGLETVLLIDRSKQWDEGDLNSYTRGNATGVTTYSHIFNAYSKLGDAQSIVFDDAHAAEGYVAASWSVEIPRKLSAYHQILDVLQADLDPLLIERMSHNEVGDLAEPEVRMLPLSVIARHKTAIAKVLSDAVAEQDDLKWSIRRVLPHIASCLFYIERSQIFIRPMIPPTFEHAPFTQPVQRVYLSATIGGGGELERAFGRQKISRIGVPEAWEKTGSGRRFFVFPSLSTAGQIPGSTPPSHVDLTRQLMDLAPKRLILAQNNKTTDAIAARLNVPEDETYRVSGGQFTTFATAKQGTLLAANRYDGMDLADDICRMMLISGLPGASHLQDRFFETKLRARAVLQERIRTRVVQGFGRCTRGPQDYSVVVVEDETLVRFLSRDENREAMPRELQAEIQFGLHTSENVTEGQLVSLTGSALAQDRKWSQGAETQIIEWREDSEVKAYTESSALAASAAKEVSAWREAWAGQWPAAGQLAMEVHAQLNGTELTPYRSLWAYLAHSWLTLAELEGAPTGKKAAEYLNLALQSSYGTTWLKEMQRTSVSSPFLEGWDVAAVEAVHRKAAAAIRPTKAMTEITQMLADVGQKEATAYERGLTLLGTYLGFNAFKPEGNARADSAWILPDLWITFEAKSEQLDGGTISPTYVRQTNTQLDMLAHDQEVDQYPAASISVMMSPKGVVNPDAVAAANKNVYLCNPTDVRQIAMDTKRVWASLRAFASDAQDQQQRTQVAKELWEAGLLPSQLRDRLTVDPVK